MKTRPLQGKLQDIFYQSLILYFKVMKKENTPTLTDSICDLRVRKVKNNFSHKLMLLSIGRKFQK